MARIRTGHFLYNGPFHISAAGRYSKDPFPEIMHCQFNCCFYFYTEKANLAQLAEHFIRNERVVGSNPIVGSPSSVTQEPVSRFLSSRTITNAAMVRVLTEPWFVSSRTIFYVYSGSVSHEPRRCGNSCTG